MNHAKATPPGKPTKVASLSTEELAQRAVDEQRHQEHRADYRHLRRKAYPSIADQLDLLYHKGVAGWKKEITKVKEQYPKPE